MHPLTLLLWLVGGTLGLCMLGALTDWISTYVKQRQRASPPSPTDPLPAHREAPETPQQAPIPEEETAGFWWTRLFTPWGMVGCLVIPLQVWVLLVNSELLAVTFETILDRVGQTRFVLPIFDWEREVTDFDLYGALISIGQMVTASAVYLGWEKRPRPRLLLGLAGVALASLIAYEVSASTYRGWKVEGDLHNAGLSGLLALGIATTDATVGILMVDRFLVAFLLAGLWSIAAPFRALSRWSRRRGAMQQTAAHPYHDGHHSAALAALSPFVALDTVVMHPLRRLDHAVGSLVSGRPHWWKKGGSPNAESPVAIQAEHARVSHNGADPVRMRGGQAPDPQGVDHLDRRA